MSLAAELHGKAPYAYSEDVLTSDVFLTFRYLPAAEGIIGFLRTVERLADLLPTPEPESTCTVYFWPQGRIREPDILLELQIAGRLYHVIVEAKYLSGPSDGELPSEMDQHCEAIRRTGNQLADQFNDLLHGHYRIRLARWITSGLDLNSDPADRFLLYLSGHHVRPVEELSRCHDRCHHSIGRLFWTNWYQIHDYLAEKYSGQALPYGIIAGDLVALLQQKGFCPFHGLPPFPLLEHGSLSKYRWRVVPGVPIFQTGSLPDFCWHG